jgi:ADP-ribose pyrophosphatase YjhB (NUDIX family)
MTPRAADLRVWQRQAKHCPLCAAPLARAEVEGRERVRCERCAFVLYENPACAAAGMVLAPDGRVLLVRRAIDPFKGFWALPAGYQEVDEEPALTAVREVFEESGIEVEVVELIDLLFVAKHAFKPANLAVYLCRPTGGTLRRGEDTLEAAWFDPDDLPRDLGFENGPRILTWLARHRDRHPGRSNRPGS